MTISSNDFFPLLKDKATGQLSVRKILEIPILLYLTWQITNSFEYGLVVQFENKSLYSIPAFNISLVGIS